MPKSQTDPVKIYQRRYKPSPLWFEPCSGHMWESQVLLTDGQVGFFPGFSSFRPPSMNDWLDISKIFLKGL